MTTVTTQPESLVHHVYHLYEDDEENRGRKRQPPYEHFGTSNENLTRPNCDRACFTCYGPTRVLASTRGQKREKEKETRGIVGTRMNGQRYSHAKSLCMLKLPQMYQCLPDTMPRCTSWYVLCTSPRLCATQRHLCASTTGTNSLPLENEWPLQSSKARRTHLTSTRCTIEDYSRHKFYHTRICFVVEQPTFVRVLCI